MYIELVRGPYDGMEWEVPDDQDFVIINQPALSPQEFIRMSERPDLVDFAVMTTTAHAYYVDRTKLAKSGRRRFIYQGVRQ
jgi:hypothetical protein